MSLSDEMTGLMNAVRGASGTTGKLGIEAATAVLSKLVAFNDHGTLTENTDLNSVLDPGTYDVTTAQNKPITNWGCLIVLKAVNRNIQIYIADIGTTYVRSGYSGTFSNPWTKLGGS